MDYLGEDQDRTMLQPLTQKQLSELLPEVCKIAAAASQRILAVYNSDFSVLEKQDSSPLTEADLASNAEICAGLQRLTPEIPVLSEESVTVPFAERSQWQRYWLVDPLDGTKEFVKRNGEFTVNIALIEGNHAVLGVVDVPVTGAVYYAAREVGAFKVASAGATPQRISAKKLDLSKIVVSGSRSHGGEALEKFTNTLPGKVELISKGSSLKLCLVAEGAADIYPRFGLTSEWDTAAAQCVVEQAGGIVTDLQFQPVLYNAKEDILNPYFLVIGDASYDWRSRLAAMG
jgi:3'(2'), 5'-bisphosphate nucleotidase